MDTKLSVYQQIRASKNSEMPVWKKECLTVEEASAYSGIGLCKMRELLYGRNCPFCISMNNKRYAVRKKLDKFIAGARKI